MYTDSSTEVTVRGSVFDFPEVKQLAFLAFYAAVCAIGPRVSYAQFLHLRENSLMSIELDLCLRLSVGWA